MFMYSPVAVYLILIPSVLLYLDIHILHHLVQKLSTATTLHNAPVFAIDYMFCKHKICTLKFGQIEGASEYFFFSENSQSIFLKVKTLGEHVKKIAFLADAFAGGGGVDH